MRKGIYITILITILAIPVVAKALDQATIDSMIFLLQQPEPVSWSENCPFNDAELYDGLETIYQMAVDDEDDRLRDNTIWAMGETGIGAFDATIISSYEGEPTVALYALGKIPSVTGVDLMITALDDEDMFVREAAAWGLGNVQHEYSMDETEDRALDALNARLEVEEEEFLIETLNAAIAYIETGLAISAIFEEVE